MNRKHNIEDYLKIINKLRKQNPEIEFSSDFIIGYPGETEEDFNETIALMKKVEFINSYSFVYSSRPGTPAANLKEIDKELAKERLKIFQEISNQINKNKKKKLLKKEVEVLFENKMKNQNKYFGRDKYLNSVVVDSDDDLRGKFFKVKIDDFNHSTLFGKILM